MTRPNPIGIVEDDDHLRVYLEEVIDGAEDLVLAFSAASLAEARGALGRTPCALCLVDLRLPDGDGLSLLPVLAGMGVKALVLTVLGDPVSVLTALKAGADGYLLKETPPEQLCISILQALAGETPLSPQAATHLLATWKSASGALTRAAEGEGLTAREVEVLKLFSRGLSYREAADILGISPHTIGDHVKCIYRKLAVHSRSEAIFEARQMGLISLLD